MTRKKRNKNASRYERAKQRYREIQTRQWYQLLIEYLQRLRDPRN